jgi:hypothetical protein
MVRNRVSGRASSKRSPRQRPVAPRTRSASSGTATKDSRAVRDGNAPIPPRSTTTFCANLDRRLVALR